MISLYDKEILKYLIESLELIELQAKEIEKLNDVISLRGEQLAANSHEISELKKNRSGHIV